MRASCGWGASKRVCGEQTKPATSLRRKTKRSTANTQQTKTKKTTTPKRSKNKHNDRGQQNANKNRTEQNITEHFLKKQNRTELDRTEQNRTERNRTAQTLRGSTVVPRLSTIVRCRWPPPPPAAAWPPSAWSASSPAAAGASAALVVCVKSMNRAPSRWVVAFARSQPQRTRARATTRVRRRAARGSRCEGMPSLRDAEVCIRQRGLRSFERGEGGGQPPGRTRLDPNPGPRARPTRSSFRAPRPRPCACLRSSQPPPLNQGRRRASNAATLATSFARRRSSLATIRSYGCEWSPRRVLS